VENIPGQAEQHSGVGQKVFGFSPESCSASPRNAVRLQPGILFDLPRNAVRLAPEYAAGDKNWQSLSIPTRGIYQWDETST
jgi:hypothetical protein